MRLKRFIPLILAFYILQLSCKKFLEIEPPKNSMVTETVFKNDDQASSAVKGIYALMTSYSSYAAGAQFSISYLAGLSSDEMIGYSPDNIPFFDNQLSPGLQSTLPSLYSGPFKTIFQANSVLEGLSLSTGITPPVKMQLQGEALFARAFAYFYLVNLFGDVPLYLETDYKKNEVQHKSTVAQIYQQIVSDLEASKDLLPEAMATANRVRPNRSAAQSLLARTYLYLQNWEKAEAYASLTIAKSGIYDLVDIDQVFLANSREAIWQLMPTPNTNTNEGSTFILEATPTVVSLRSSFVLNSFEPGDRRQLSWIKAFNNNSGTYYYPFKYKIKNSATVTEYSMVLRLAEQFLIRAEARINLGRIEQGVSDINRIRERARSLPSDDVPNPLPPFPSTLSKAEALLAVEQERKVELFSEWGHRWLDLKRTGRANPVLQSIKPNWTPTGSLYPIPQDEINRNRNITQNPGY